MNTICDLHSHSVLSNHAYSSLTENIEYASSIGLKYYGISEHQPDLVGVGSPRYAITNVKVLPRKYKDTYVLRGVELNILENGVVDIDPNELKSIDYAIASMHGYVYEDSHTFEENTIAYLNVLDNPYVKILGHMDTSSYACDYKKIIKKVIDKHKLIEVNNASLNPLGHRYLLNSKENYKTILDILKKNNYPIIINSDAHIKYDIGKFDYTEEFFNEYDFPKELILNYNEELFLEYFGYIFDKKA